MRGCGTPVRSACTGSFQRGLRHRVRHGQLSERPPGAPANHPNELNGRRRRPLSCSTIRCMAQLHLIDYNHDVRRVNASTREYESADWVLSDAWREALSRGGRVYLTRRRAAKASLAAPSRRFEKSPLNRDSFGGGPCISPPTKKAAVSSPDGKAGNASPSSLPSGPRHWSMTAVLRRTR
jgi:hypothetical protein